MSNKHCKSNTPEGRLIEFPNSGLTVRGKRLWCDPCDSEVTAAKKSTIQNHISSNSHRIAKASKATAVTVTDYFVPDGAVASSSERWNEMVRVFTASNIPLHKFRNPPFRTWMKNNVKFGCTMPCETGLRKILSREGDRDLDRTKLFCRNQDVALMADETADIKNRKTLNILVKPLGSNHKFRLATTSLIDRCDAQTISLSVLECLNKLEIPVQRLVSFHSDNARYMIAAGNTLKGLSTRLLHSTCWCHVLHLVAEEIRMEMECCNTFISNMKSALVKSPARRNELLDFFERFGKPRALPPEPIVTRWCTWIEAGTFHWDHFEAEVAWIHETEPDSLAVKKLKAICSDSDLPIQLKKISDICGTLSSTIKTFESHNLPASDIWLYLVTLQGCIEECLGVVSTKLQEYMETKHPAFTFWKEVQYLDPRKAEQFCENGQELLPNSISKLAVETVSRSELNLYRNIRQTHFYEMNFCPVEFWKKYSREMPSLSTLALKVLQIPASTADVERSFSTLKSTLTSQRNKFTEANLETHMRLQFNSEFEDE